MSLKNKAVLISIRPEWCDLIVRGKKTIEVRKTRPKLEMPFKVYIYCTKAPQHLITIFKDGEETMDGEIHHGKPEFLKCDKYLPDSIRDKTQMVIGEFTCDDIDRITPLTSSIPGNLEERILGSCLTAQQVEAYAGWKGWMRLADCHDAYCWHISGLRVYKKPKSLFDFHRAVDEDELWCEKCAVGGKKSTSCGFCYGLDGLRIRRPPQSWCYVAEAKEDDAL